MRKASEVLGRTPLSDVPTTQDMLGYRQVVEPLASRILAADCSNTPFTVGVHGEWGSGKTSFLLLLDERLRRGGVTPVWFNAWKYEREENLWSALLQTVLLQARIRGNWPRRLQVRFVLWWRSLSLRQGIWEITQKVGSPVLRIGLVAVVLVLFVSLPQWIAKMVGNKDPVATVLLDSSRLQLSLFARCMLGLALVVVVKPEILLKVFDSRLGIDFKKFSHTRSYVQQIALVDDLTSELEALISLIGKGKPLVVIVDDLDRCLPEKVMEVLEAIKLFLDVPGCVFVLGMDRNLVENAVSRKLQTAQNATNVSSLYHSLASAYFDKLIHLPFAVPPLSQESIKTLVRHVAPDDEAKSCADLLAIGLQPNPRTVKRHIQTLVFLRDVARTQLAGRPLHISLLAKTVIVQNTYRELYDEIKEDPRLLAEMEKFSRSGQDDSLGDGQTLDAGERVRIQAYLDKFPRLRALLKLATDDNDSFGKTNVHDYIFLSRAISELKEGGGTLRATSEADRTDDVKPNRRLLELVEGIRQVARASGPERVFVEPLLTQLGTKGVGSSKELTLRDLLAQSTRLLIVGEGGSGKTTLLRHIAVLMAEAYTSRNRSQLETELGLRRPRLPLLLSGADFVSLSHVTRPSALLEFFTTRYAKFSERALDEAFERGECILMLDGLSEVPEQDFRQVSEVISRLEVAYPLNTFIASTRSGHTEYVQPFEHFDKFSLKWNEERIQLLARGYWELTRANPHLFQGILGRAIAENEDLRNPAMVQILVTLAAQSEVAGTPFNIRDMVGVFIQRSISRIRTTTSRELSIAALRVIGTAMTGPDMTSSIDGQRIAELLKSHLGISAEQTFEILTALREGGLIAEVRPGEYTFAHDLYAQYFRQLATSEETTN
jgi:energy-coupling factor transporter ATP-binding protein EcfA2